MADARFPTFEMLTTCPFCGIRNEASSSPTGGRGPIDGDVSLCFSCGEWGVYSSKRQGGMRKPRFKEYEEIAANPTLRKMRELWLVVKEEQARETSSIWPDAANA